MIRKIVSSGTGGVARAALETAVKLDLSVGGWTAEADPDERRLLAERFGLEGVGSGNPREADRLNLEEADATLLLTRGGIDSRTEQIKRRCEQLAKPVLHLDVGATGAFHAARKIFEWTADMEMGVLHVAGTDAGRDPGLSGIAQNLLEAFLTLQLMPPDAASFSGPAGLAEDRGLPASVSEAVERLKGHLSLKDRATIANMSEPELASLDATLGEYIRTAFQLRTGNEALLESCRWISKKTGAGRGGAAAVVIFELWQNLKQTHTIRIIK